MIGTYLDCAKVCGSRSVPIASVNSTVENDNTMGQPFGRAGVHAFAGTWLKRLEDLPHAKSQSESLSDNR